MQFQLDRRKRPNEKFRIGIDFTGDLEVGDSVASQTITAVDSKGTVVTGTLLASPGFNGNIVSALVQAGTEGMVYRVFFQATTSNGSILQHSVVVPVGLNT